MYLRIKSNFLAIKTKLQNLVEWKNKVPENGNS